MAIERKLQLGLRVSIPDQDQEQEQSPRLPLPVPPRGLKLPTHNVQRLPDLEKIRILGNGSAGKVYKVRDRKTQAVYALKVIPVDHQNMSVRRQIVTEMEILTKTNSPFVVKCEGIFENGGDINFVLEYMDGGSLANLAEQEWRISESFVAKVAKDVLQGLEYLRTQKIVHRDIKPANLLINRKKEIKIADFGVSRILSQTCDSYVGTCSYMSPERLDPDSYDGNYDVYGGDIWSLGLTLLECYIGHYPFLPPGQQPDWPNLIFAICFGDPPSPPPTASADFQSFIRCCLQKDPRRRWTATRLLAHPFLKQSRQFSRG